MNNNNSTDKIRLDPPLGNHNMNSSYNNHNPNTSNNRITSSVSNFFKQKEVNKIRVQTANVNSKRLTINDL